MITLRLVITSLLLMATSWPAAAWGLITPSQVLVLYNADWSGDEPLTEPGQDSREIADHYLRMHTDPASGEKPYILGLSCRHGKALLGKVRHLDDAHLAEGSSDNKSGVIMAGRGFLKLADLRDSELRDSRAVEFTLPGGPEEWQLDTLRLDIDPAEGDDITVIKGGLVVKPGPVAINAARGWTVRLDARAYAAGALKVKIWCDDTDGKRSSWDAAYIDADQVKFSRTGRDGARDDQHFLDDVAQPVRTFLDDPANARPDGTLLKDHILYIVVAYGLPRTAVATYGIARGVTDIPSNQGSIIAFEQRLQLLYYDEELSLGTVPKPHRFKGKGPFTDFFLRAPQAWPLLGPQANPFVHPLAYQKKSGSLGDLPEPLAFTATNRNRQAGRHLFFVSRIDGGTPLEARGLIDRAVYASKYAGAMMGQLADREYPRSKERVGRLSGSLAGQWLWERGFRHLYYGGASRHRLELFHLPPGDGFLNRDPVYLPGGIGATVISHNGWGKGEMRGDLARGVTGTIGAAKVYQGAPHIHNQSWWDDEILYPSLLRGKSLGEAWLMNQVHLGWIATFVGDPLYRLPNTAVRDETPPRFNPGGSMRVRIVKDEQSGKQVWLVVDLASRADTPKVAQLRAVSPHGVESICQSFEARPYVKLGDMQSACGRDWQIELVDPFGNRNSSTVGVDCESGQVVHASERGVS